MPGTSFRAIVPKQGIIVPGRFKEDLRAELTAWKDSVVKELQTYPWQTFRKHKKFVSTKQRKYFFYALRHGLINVPYKRTRAVRRAVDGQVVDTGDGYIASIELDSDVAPHVHGVIGTRDEQWQDMQERGWPNYDVVAQKHWKSTFPKLKARFDRLVKP